MQEAIQENFWTEMVPPGNLLHWYGGENSYGSTMRHIQLTHLEANISICITEVYCYLFFIVPISNNFIVFWFNDSFIDFSHKFIKYHTSIKLSAKDHILNNNQSEMCFTETYQRVWYFRLSYHWVSVLRETFKLVSSVTVDSLSLVPWSWPAQFHTLLEHFTSIQLYCLALLVSSPCPSVSSCHPASFPTTISSLSDLFFLATCFITLGLVQNDITLQKYDILSIEGNLGYFRVCLPLPYILYTTRSNGKQRFQTREIIKLI